MTAPISSYPEHIAAKVQKFNNWLELMGSHDGVSVTFDVFTHTIVSVQVYPVPARDSNEVPPLTDRDSDLTPLHEG